MIKPCVYIITNSSNNVLYTGVTSNLQKRMLQHIDKSFGGFSARYNLSKLVFFEEFGSMTQAIDREKQIKITSLVLLHGFDLLCKRRTYFQNLRVLRKYAEYLSSA